MNLADTLYTYRFIRILVSKWTEMDAYKLGIIDEDGKALKKARELKGKEKDAFTTFHRLVFNIKRLLEKLPFGKSRLASWSAALFLLKEHTNVQASDFMDILSDEFGIDFEDDINESWILIDEDQLMRGSFTLVNETLCPKSGEVIGKPGQQVVSEDNNMAVDRIGNTPIFEVKHKISGATLYVTTEDIQR